MWRREVTMPPRDMVHSQNDIKWQDSDNGASWHYFPPWEKRKLPVFFF